MTGEQLAALTALVAVVVGPIVTVLVANRQNRTTLLAAHKQFQADVVSTSRQRWIDDLRTSVADFQAAITEVTYRATLGPHGKWQDDPRLERATYLRHRIALLINPHEPDHAELLQLIGTRLSLVAVPPDSEVLRHGQGLNERITTLGQAILKREWERVKEGEPLPITAPLLRRAP